MVKLLNEAEATFSSNVEGLKTAGLDDLLQDIANHFQLRLNITHIDKGWIRNKYYFSVSGGRQQIAAFISALERSIAAYNER
jgi:hypothetical protein